MDNRLKGKTCPYCKTQIKEDDTIAVCSICEMPHHLSCWNENNGCTTFGCTGKIKEIIGNNTTNITEAQARTTDQQYLDMPVQKAAVLPRRFEVLSESMPNTIPDNIPVLVEKISLIIDHQNESLTARCIFRSLTDKPLVAILVDVICTDVWGNPTETVEGVQFLDLKTKRDSTFGQTTPIHISGAETRSVDVLIKKVMYSDRTTVEANSEVSVLPSQDTLEAFFGNAEISGEYIRETTDRAKYTPITGKNYWRCACGAINSNADTDCYNCKSDKSQLFELLNTEVLSINLEAYKEEKRLRAEREQAERDEHMRQAEEQMRLAQEEKERKDKEEAERKAEIIRQKKVKLKKALKRASLLTAIVLVFGFIVYAAGWHVIPYIQYQSACKAVEDNDFDKAYHIFISLGDFRDSQGKATDTLYQKGIYLISSGSYSEAATVFDSIPGYLDSSEQAVFCRNESAYLEATSLLECGKYKEAADAFTVLARNGYSDSADQANASNYLYAQQLFDNGKYEEAYTVFNSLSDYKNSKALAEESEYLYAIERFDAGDYEKAVSAFKIVKDYKDVPDRLPEARYQYALFLTESGDLDTAATQLKLLGDYKDSAERFKETYYQYGLQLLNKGSYSAAVAVFNTLGKYQDSKTKLNEAKYEYVLQHNNKTDVTTYSYLKDLKAIGYKDSKAIYNSLYAWHVNIIINDSETNELTCMTTISKYSTVYCHVTLTGGPPNESIEIRYSYTWPKSSANGDSWDWKWRSGDSGWFCTWYEYPVYGNTGTFKVRVYNKSTGELLGESTVTITN